MVDSHQQTTRTPLPDSDSKKEVESQQELNRGTPKPTLNALLQYDVRLYPLVAPSPLGLHPIQHLLPLIVRWWEQENFLTNQGG